MSDIQKGKAMIDWEEVERLEWGLLIITLDQLVPISVIVVDEHENILEKTINLADYYNE
jgi:PII-like signaling protein